MAKKRSEWNHDMDAFLAKHYAPTVKGRSKRIAECLCVPRWAVNRRASALGLSRVKDRPWSREDEEYLAANLHKTALRQIAGKLGRSPTAIKLKAKRLGLRKHGEGYTVTSLAQALGVDPHWVLARILSGKLRGGRRHTERTEAQHGDSWLITDDAVAAFIGQHPYDIDLRKVDRLWFMDLIAERLKERVAGSNGGRRRTDCEADAVEEETEECS